MADRLQSPSRRRNGALGSSLPERDTHISSSTEPFIQQPNLSSVQQQMKAPAKGAALPVDALPLEPALETKRGAPMLPPQTPSRQVSLAPAVLSIATFRSPASATSRVYFGRPWTLSRAKPACS
jgi:hypothetical protein